VVEDGSFSRVAQKK
jgi:hypothetical protein